VGWGDGRGGSSRVAQSPRSPGIPHISTDPVDMLIISSDLQIPSRNEKALNSIINWDAYLLISVNPLALCTHTLVFNWEVKELYILLFNVEKIYVV
jgi:hypothetical protein